MLTTILKAPRHRRRLLLLAAAVGLAAAGLAGTAGGAVHANSAGYSDPVGDSGTAPDLGAVNVSNDDTGKLTLQIAIANRPQLAASDLVLVLMDTDGNSTNGLGGADYVAAVAADGSMLLISAGGNLTRANAPSFSGSYTAGVATITLDVHEIGNPSTINFAAGASGDDGDSVGDLAGPWSYQVIVAPTAPPTATPPAAPLTLSVLEAGTSKARAGRPFAAALTVRRNDTHELLEEGRVTCAARINGTPLKAAQKTGPDAGVAVCAWQLPKTAKGKRLTGSITVTEQGVSVTRTFSARVL